LRHELEEVEKHVCPNLSSSRNAFQAVVEILARRKVASRVRLGCCGVRYSNMIQLL
jgi:hypothetical protein